MESKRVTTISFEMKTLELILALTILVKVVIAVPVNCHFILYKDDGYTCRVKYGEFKKDEPMTASTGTHLLGRNDKKIEALFVSKDSPIMFLPIGTCEFFASLKKIEIESHNLTEISRNVFLSCAAVEVVNIYYSRLTWLPGDVFYELVNLVELRIKKNLMLTYLPANLFAKNSKLDKIVFDSNRLMIIKAKLPTTLSLVSFKEMCIDKKYSKDKANIREINLDLQNNCQIEGLEKEKLDLESRINVLESKAAKPQLSETLQQGNASLSSLMIQNDEMKLKIAQLEEFQTYCHEMTENLREEESTETLNLTDKCVQNLNEANQNLSNLKKSNETLQITVENLENEVKRLHEALAQQSHEKCAEATVLNAQSSSDNHGPKFYLLITGILIAVLSIGWIITIAVYMRSRSTIYRIPNIHSMHELTD